MSTHGRTTARRLMQSVFASEWAIRPEWLREFAGLAQRFGESSSGPLTAEEVRIEIRRALAELNDGREAMQALTADSGPVLQEGSRATVRDGVAIVPVSGPLFHYASGFDDVCGCTSYEQIARDIAAVRAARARGSVHSALFVFDTPGGEVAGCAEAADLIAELAAEMPNAGYVSDLCCSAGIWLASAMSKLVGARSSLLGSIGVVAAYRAKDDSGVIEIVSSQSPKKRPDVATAEGRAQIQDTVDALAEVFVADVARQRGVSVDKVMSDFGQGDVLVGANAVDAGLIDDIGSFEGVLAELAGRKGASSRGAFNSLTREIPMAETTNASADAEQPVITKDSLIASHAAIVAELRADGATSERERILGIEKLSIKGHAKLIAEMKADPKVSVEQAAVRLIQAEQEAGTRTLANLRGDEDSIEDMPAASAGDEGESEQSLAHRIATLGRPVTK